MMRLSDRCTERIAAFPRSGGLSEGFSLFSEGFSEGCSDGFSEGSSLFSEGFSEGGLFRGLFRELFRGLSRVPFRGRYCDDPVPVIKAYLSSASLFWCAIVCVCLCARAPVLVTARVRGTPVLVTAHPMPVCAGR